jgi:glycogen debranching enzyme
MFENHDLSDNIGDIRNETKRRTRKPRKQNEKEILHEYKADVERERESTLQKQRKIYENIEYLSEKENVIKLLKEKYNSTRTLKKKCNKVHLQQQNTLIISKSKLLVRYPLCYL